MNFTFKKEISENSKAVGTKSSSLCQYSVTNNLRLVGTLLYGNRKSLLTIDNLTYVLNQKWRVIRNTSISIKEEITNKEIGFFKLTAWTIFLGYRDKILIGDNTYILKRETPEVKYSIFNKNTWWYYEFSLSNKTTKINYSFNINGVPSISLGNIIPKLEFDGIIETQLEDYFLIVAGLFLIEENLRAPA